jgi:hypothetical protein
MKKPLVALVLALACTPALDAPARVPACYASPEATIEAYWHCMAERRHADALGCFLDSQPEDVAQMLYLPELVELRCRDFSVRWQGGGVVDVVYQVEYRITLADSLQRFPTGDRLHFTGGGWKIAFPLLAAARSS